MLSLLFLSLLTHAQVQYSAIGNSMVGATLGTLTGDRVRMTRYLVNEDGWMNTVMVHVTPGSTQKIRGVVYDDMKKLLGFTGEVTIDSSMAPGWQRLKTHQPIKVVKNSYIYIGVHSDVAVTPGKFRFTAGGGGRTIITVPYLDGPPQTATTIDTTLDGFLSIYAVVYNGECPTGSCLMITWAPASSGSPATAFEIGYGTTGNYTKFVVAPGADTKALISGLSPFTSYCVAVRAMDALNNKSAWSNEICNSTMGPLSINSLKLN